MAIGTAAAILGGAVIGGIASKKAGDTAARAQEQAAQTSAAAQERMFQKQVELQEPWRQAGVNALAQLQRQTGAMPAAFSGQVDMSQDPGYAFRLAEGQKALERSAAARGGLLSGAMLKGTQRFGQELASQEYQNAYNRALTEYNARVAREATGYNRLAELAGVGQTATGALSSAAQNLGANLGDLYYGAGTGAGQARASGYLGMGNAVTSALGTGLNYYQGQQLMNKMFPASGAGAGTFGGGYSPVPGGGVPSTPFFAR